MILGFKSFLGDDGIKTITRYFDSIQEILSKQAKTTNIDSIIISDCPKINFRLLFKNLSKLPNMLKI